MTRAAWTTATALGLLALLLGGAAAEEEAASPGLVLEATAASPEVVSGEPLQLEATFRNAGAAALQILLPQHLGSVVFPRWTFRHEGGQAYAPAQATFQTMWEEGLMGSILVLEPGASKTFARTVTRVVALHPQRRSLGLEDAVPLPPGRYAVVAGYAKEDDLVPWALEDFRSETRRHEGLWTGAVEAAPFEVTVGPSDRPRLLLRAPEEARVGEAFPVRLELANDREEAFERRVALVVDVAAKAYASGRARFVLTEEGPRPAWEGRAHALRLGPGERRGIEMDLAATTFRVQAPGDERPAGLFDVVPPGLFRITVGLVDEGGERLAAAGLYRRHPEVEPPVPVGLALVLEPVHDRSPGVRVAVALRNEGTEPVRVPARLAYPRHVFFSLVRPQGDERAPYSVTQRASEHLLMDPDEPGGRARIHRGWSWDGDRYEQVPPLEAQSLVLLAPGAEIRRVFDLDEIVHGQRPVTAAHGAFRLQAFWRNRDTGWRLGLEPPLAVGLLASEPLVVRGRNW